LFAPPFPPAIHPTPLPPYSHDLPATSPPVSISKVCSPRPLEVQRTQRRMSSSSSRRAAVAQSAATE